MTVLTVLYCSWVVFETPPLFLSIQKTLGLMLLLCYWIVMNGTDNCFLWTLCKSCSCIYIWFFISFEKLGLNMYNNKSHIPVGQTKTCWFLYMWSSSFQPHSIMFALILCEDKISWILLISVHVYSSPLSQQEKQKRSRVITVLEILNIQMPAKTTVRNETLSISEQKLIL